MKKEIKNIKIINSNLKITNKKLFDVGNINIKKIQESKINLKNENDKQSNNVIKQIINLTKNGKHNDDRLGLLYEELYNLNYKRIFNKIIVSTSTFDKLEIDEVIQNTFIKVFINLNNYKLDENKKFSNWILTICQNEIKNKYKENNKIINFRNLENEYGEEFYSKSDIFLDFNSNLREGLIFEENKTQLFEAMKILNKNEKTILTLKYFNNKTNLEISNILKIPYGTIGTVLKRTKEKMKKVLLNDLAFI